MVSKTEDEFIAEDQEYQDWLESLFEPFNDDNFLDWCEEQNESI